jgi:uncharacterized spore protein YtfJ
MMDTEIERLLDLLAELRDKADVNAAFGEPMTVEGRTIVPVARVAYGFGMGLGHMTRAEPTAETEMGTDQPQDREIAEPGDGTGGVGGGGIVARPFAVIEVTPEGTRVEPVVNEQKLALAGSLLIGWSVFCLARTLVKIFGHD